MSVDGLDAWSSAHWVTEMMELKMRLTRVGCRFTNLRANSRSSSKDLVEIISFVEEMSRF